MNRPRGGVLGLVAALLFASCDRGELGGIREDVALHNLGGCAEVEAYIKLQAARHMNAQIDGALQGLAMRTGVERGVSIPAPAPAAAPTAQDFTTTNTQERDVDEADFVKNDGSRIFVLHDRYLVALAAWPAASTRMESITRLEGHPVEMLFHDGKIVVFSQVDLRRAFAQAGSRAPIVSPSGFKITVLDVKQSEPRVLFEEYREGRYVSSRRVGPAVRIVSTVAQPGPLLRYWPQETFNWSDMSGLVEAFERLRKQNLEVIRSSHLEDWLPRSVALVPGEGPRFQAETCGEEFFASNAPVDLGISTVTSLNLDRPSQASGHTSILVGVDMVYASRDSLYLSARHYWSPSRPVAQTEDHTYLHKFDIASHPSRARYVASGGVPGHVLNQFSMGEDRGFLRVATTRQGWGSGNAEQANDVFVLATRGDRLATVGELRGLAPGERIYAARFLGDRGYLVTFRKVDPLFALDLTAPAQPRLAGELKVPGFSTYIHPLETGHLLTIGRDTIDSGGGFDWFQELTLQVFDVSNLADPRLRHKSEFGSRSSSSEAAYDHKAFNFFASRGLLGIPFSDWSWSRPSAGFRSSLEVFQVSVEKGIVSAGSIDHSDLTKPALYRGYPGWMPAVRRSVMMEDYVYSISYGGLKVSSMRNLSAALATIPFPDPVPWNEP